jgi:hypothetical protein
MKEDSCTTPDCQHVAHVEFDLGYGTRWFCFTHAVEMFEKWDGPLAVTTFPDRSLFDCAGYPERLSLLATVYESGADAAIEESP